VGKTKADITANEMREAYLESRKGKKDVVSFEVKITPDMQTSAGRTVRKIKNKEFVDVVSMSSASNHIICVEIKSGKTDYFSGSAFSFWGDENYLLISKKTYDLVWENIPKGIGIILASKENDGGVTLSLERPSDRSPNHLVDPALMWNAMLMSLAHQFRNYVLAHKAFCEGKTQKAYPLDIWKNRNEAKSMRRTTPSRTRV
jgi:hypothetical protein